MSLPDKHKLHFRTSNKAFMERSIFGIVQFVDYVRSCGVEVEKMLEGSGIHIDDLNDHDRFITIGQEMIILRKLLSLIPDNGLGFEIGKNANISANARVAIPAMFCRNFLEAIVLMFKYIDLSLSNFQYDLFIKDDLASINMKELFHFGDFRRFICELELAAVYSICKTMIGGPLVLKRIDLAYARPPHAGLYEEFFKCPVYFNSDRHTLILDSTQLYQPLPMSNPLARAAYEKDCRRIQKRITEKNSILDRISQELMTAEGKEFPSFERLARRLNMSGRTLRRHMSAEGTSYQAAINEILRDKASQLLLQTDFSIEKIAGDLGYSAASNFCHAFKRWLGVTPSEYRDKNAS